ncbi:MAG: response regulator [Anaerolineae bacterium]|nr:response regulator [Anaerolineae bacterium]
MPNLAFVIEDDPDTAFIFSRALTVNGYQCEIIYNGMTALERLKSQSPSLVLLDLHLPEVSGTDLLALLRCSEHLANTVVIIITANPRLAQIYQSQGEKVLVKPVTFSQVRDLAASIRSENAI